MLKKVLLMAGIIVVLVFLVVKTVDIPQLLSVVQSLTLAEIGMLIALSLSLEAFKALRFHILLRDRNIEVSIFQSIKVYLSGESASLLPGGEGVRLVFLSKETNTSYVQSTAPTLSSSLFDSVVAAVVVSFGALFFEELRLAALIIDVLLIGGLVIILHPKLFSWLTNLMAKVPKLSTKVDFTMKVRGVLVNLLTAQGHRVLPGSATLLSVVISLVSMGVGGYLFYFLVQLIGSSTSWPEAILLYASSIVISAISGFIPGGLGLTEGGITGILYVIARLSYQQAVSVALIYRGFTAGLYMLLGIVITAIAYGPQLKPGEPKEFPK